MPENVKQNGEKGCRRTLQNVLAAERQPGNLFDIEMKYYFGPKKSLRYLEEHEPEVFEIYAAALREPTCAHVQNWIDCLKERFEKGIG